jgi:RimJ/RimL family protein N-acetyltransferase
VELRDRLTEVWPLFGLRVRTPRLELRIIDDADSLDLARIAGDIHGPDERPFAVPWNLADTDAERQRRVLQFNWAQRAEHTPERWHLTFATVVDGDVVGMQGMSAEQFGHRGSVASGSWITRPHQGKGIGTEMRAAMLHLAFDGLGAQRAESGAYEDNPRSLSVSRRNGYRANGDHLHWDGERLKREVRLVVERTDWEPLRRDDIEVVGLEPCLSLLGVPPA